MPAYLVRLTTVFALAGDRPASLNDYEQAAAAVAEAVPQAVCTGTGEPGVYEFAVPAEAETPVLALLAAARQVTAAADSADGGGVWLTERAVSVEPA